MKTTDQTTLAAGRRVRFPVFESIAQTASALGVPVAFIKRAKRDGCAAFMTGNRVDTAILIPHLFKLLGQRESNLLDPAQEKAKLDMERRIALEDERKIRQGEMHVLADVEEMLWQGVLLPMREDWLNLSRLCASQCNPQDPVLAKKVLDDYAAAAFKKINNKK